MQTASPLETSYKSVSKDRIIAEPAQGCCSWLSSLKPGFGSLGEQGDLAEQGVLCCFACRFVGPCTVCAGLNLAPLPLLLQATPRCLRPSSERDLCFGI